MKAGAPPLHSPCAAPLFDWRGALVALIAAIVLCWPMLTVGGPLIYFDTLSYIDRGETIASVLFGGTGGAEGPGGEPRSAELSSGAALRSAPYAFYAYLTSASPLGLYLTCVLQSAIVVWAFFALVPPLTRRGTLILAGGAIAVAALSSLAWFASYAMPDILGALIPIYYAMVLRDFGGLAVWQRLALGALATGGLLAHYGNLPLAGVLAIAICAYAFWQKRLSVPMLISAFAPLALAAATNFTGGSVATNDASVAPNRMPILLARSLEDGPARWYLDEACPEADFAMCELFDTMPSDITAFLWAEQGIKRASDAQVKAIREEETQILLATFQRYPVQQTFALIDNALLQFISTGTDKIYTMVPGDSALQPATLRLPDDELQRTAPIRAFDAIIPLATFAAALGLIAASLSGRIPRPVIETGAVLLAALAINAAIYGGLSAPVDRYQSRLAWLIPALLVLGLAMRASGYPGSRRANEAPVA